MNATKGNVAAPAEEKATAQNVADEMTAEKEQAVESEQAAEEQPVRAEQEEHQPEKAGMHSTDARFERLERRIAELEAFAVKVRQKLHFADQEVTLPTKRNHNPDYLPHSSEGVVSYHDKPRNQE